MGSLCTQDTLMGPQTGGDHDQIRLGTTYHEMDSQVLSAAEGFDLPGGRGTVVVLAIAGGLLIVGAGQGLQDFLMAAFAVVIVEIKHR